MAESVANLTNLKYQSSHIELNLGNILVVTLLSVLGTGFVAWSSNYLARTEIPVVSQLAIGAQNYLHAA